MYTFFGYLSLTISNILLIISFILSISSIYNFRISYKLNENSEYEEITNNIFTFLELLVIGFSIGSKIFTPKNLTCNKELMWNK